MLDQQKREETIWKGIRGMECGVDQIRTIIKMLVEKRLSLAARFE